MIGPTSPPGWYLDHSTQQWWWWDGYRWTVPAGATAHAEPDVTWFPATPALRFPAAVAGIVFMVVLTVVSRVATLLDDGPRAVVELTMLAVSTVGMPGLAWFASRRWGTGRVVDDLGLRVRWIDLALGVGGGIVVLISVIVINVVAQALGAQRGTNLEDVIEAGRDPLTFLILFVLAGILAPVTEELLFRATIQRGLESRIGVWVAVIVQGVVFGAAHYTPDQGWGNVNLILSIAVVGMALGTLARLTGRMGTPMIAHATFNCLQLGLLWLALGAT